MRLIDADRLLQVLEINFGHTGGADVMRQLIEAQPTFTLLNEPLACDGCIHEHNEHENCNYCQRASYLGDYYYCPPEGEEET